MTRSSKNQTIRPIRTRVMIACEGESEQGYGQLLNDYLRQQGVAFHIQTINLNPGAGSPLSCIEKAVRLMKQQEKKKGNFSFRVALLDTDRLDDFKNKKASIEEIANKNKIRIIWQDPCIEAFLFRHFDGHEHDRPNTNDDAMAALQKVWPNYKKGMPSSGLAKNISLGDCLRVSALEPELSALLLFLELKPKPS